MNGVWPDFEGGSIFNLMQDIERSRGGRSRQPGVSGADLHGWAGTRTVVLLVLDGVGMAQLDLLPEDSFLRRHCRRSVTSVFPSTTATAITTFMTGQSPAVHGMTGWHVRAVEPGLDGRVLAILPVSPRGGGELALSPEDVLQRTCSAPALFSTLPCRSWVISPAEIACSPFNTRHSSGADIVPYAGLEGMLDALTGALSALDPPDYVYAYWPDFDHCAHMRGCASEQAFALLKAADAAIGDWADTPAARRATLIITADHGFIDAPPERLIDIETHPDLAACLDGPLSGERRAAYCHVKRGSTRAFERALSSIEHACVVWRSEDLIAAGRFGPGREHPRLRERIGDYTLEMKADWTVRDTVEGERAYRLIGVHGGTSAAEMTVPMVVIPPR